MFLIIWTSALSTVNNLNDWSCFKTYDIRGKVGSNFDKTSCRKIAIAFSICLKAKKVVVGHDSRLSSPEMARSIIDGLISQGVKVLNIGLSGTEEMYFATEFFNACGGIQITASHNPVEYNGLKLVKSRAALDIEMEFKKLRNW